MPSRSTAAAATAAATTSTEDAAEAAPRAPEAEATRRRPRRRRGRPPSVSAAAAAAALFLSASSPSRVAVAFAAASGAEDGPSAPGGAVRRRRSRPDGGGGGRPPPPPRDDDRPSSPPGLVVGGRRRSLLRPLGSDDLLAASRRLRPRSERRALSYVDDANCDSSEQAFLLTVQTDAYGKETSWFLRKDDASSSAADASAFGTATAATSDDYVDYGPRDGISYGDHALYSFVRCLTVGSTYTLAIEDDFGDGMCCLRGHGGYEYSLGGKRQYGTYLRRTFLDYVEHTFTVEGSYAPEPAPEPPAKDPIEECVPNPSECGCDDVEQVDYRGDVSVTETGRTCQDWDSNSPHVHDYTSANYPGADLYENECRSPTGGIPWCYTSDPNKEWEYCRVPSCPIATIDPDATEGPTTSEAPSQKPTTEPTKPGETRDPTRSPTRSPSAAPTGAPTVSFRLGSAVWKILRARLASWGTPDGRGWTGRWTEGLERMSLPTSKNAMSISFLILGTPCVDRGSPTPPPTKQPTLPPTPPPNVLNPANGCYGGDVKVTVETRADNHGEDTSWDLFDHSQPDVPVMTQAKNTYEANEYKASRKCVPHGNYTFVVRDGYGDGMCCRYGKGFFRVHLDDRLVLNGGSYNKEVRETLRIGYDPAGDMTERDFLYLEAHNTRRKEWHEEYNLTYVPLTYSPLLAEDARLWAEELLHTCSVIGIEHEAMNPFGENLAKNTGAAETWGKLKDPWLVVGRWVDKEVGLPYPSNGHLTQALWRAGFYLGCGESVKPFRNGLCRIQVCRYGRAGNCDMTAFDARKGENWLEPMLLNYTRCGPDCPQEGCF
ncbi:hypothetical protein ACHAWF_004711 [Thalassiosira exigua]